MKFCLSTAVFNALILTPFVLVYLSLVSVNAQVMTSTNYQIQSDSINGAGGLSSSTNYIVESTLGEVGSGSSGSGSYEVRAGYQQMQEVYVAISVASSSLTLSPSIPGITGGSANGSTTVTVTTDNLAGYQLTIQALNNPAMQKGADSIADYSPAGVPDYTFTTGSADAYFGYTPEGSDTVQRFLDDGFGCNTGSSNTASSCWDGLSTSPVTISQSTTSNHPIGTDTLVRFRVGVGNSVIQSPGIYTATTTITATAL